MISPSLWLPPLRMTRPVTGGRASSSRRYFDCREPQQLDARKRLLTSAAAASVDADLERAVLENARIRCTPDFQEGLASFLEKRKPVWRGEE